MGKPGTKKRPMGSRQMRPFKKQKRIQQEYHSDSDSEVQGAEGEDQDFDAVNLLDSDDDIHNAKVDDVGAEDDSDMSSSDEEETQPKKLKAGAAKGQLKAKLPVKKSQKDSDNEEELDDEDDDDDDDEDDDDEEGLDDLEDNDEFDIEDDRADKKPKKRNDPTAFATSLSKILSTKLSSSKRSDPVLSRSAAAHETSKAVLDSALEAKAKRQLKDQKKKAMEKGRVKDVLVATRVETSTEEQPSTTTAEILAAEAKLRKVAQRGVVKMFNAVRAAQVKSTEAERAAKEQGMLGMGRREEKVNEMSKKGFLDLIASGGGGLKKGGLEEA
ncbi:pre-60S ribosomal particles component [Lecanicillium sp. MT-2017a]|nr:pre-60S ribosomal particles component [Lecanicillium sp. MT-2017a]